MKCQVCDGQGWYENPVDDSDDDDFVECGRCYGTGRLSRIACAYERMSFWYGQRVKQLAFSKIGRWYWKRFCMRRNALRLTKTRTPLELHVLHGQRLNRLRQWATIIESDGPTYGLDAQRAYEIEQRLVAEAGLACKIKSTSKSGGGQ